MPASATATVRAAAARLRRAEPRRAGGCGAGIPEPSWHRCAACATASRARCIGLAVGDALAAATQYRRPGSFARGGRPARRRSLRPAARRLERRHGDGAVPRGEPGRARGLRRPGPARALPPLAARGLPVGDRPVPGHHAATGARTGRGAVARAALRRHRTIPRSSIPSRCRASHRWSCMHSPIPEQALRYAAESARASPARRRWCSMPAGCSPPCCTRR